ncbi:DnaJ C-terminal domain-containing protein [Streptomyces californicus]|uniref:DnaJ C-terminal domain-containing protein n=1 Tax=Streptomyces californicus TaxID=67351 RepID=UPI0037B9C031
MGRPALPPLSAHRVRRGAGGGSPHARAIASALARRSSARSCATCEGEGRLIQWQHNHRVRLPSGIEDGQKIRLRERGAPGTHGGAPGDLYVTVHVTS